MKTTVLAAAVLAAAVSTAQPPTVSSRLTDSQIIGAVRTANDFTIKSCKTALKRGSSPEIKAYAEHLRTDHDAANKELDDLAKTSKLRAENSATSESIKRMGKEDLSRLKEADSPAFDRAFLDTQVQGHRNFIEFVDRARIDVRDTALAAYLERARDFANQHLEEGQHLQRTLGPTPLSSRRH